jgi:propanol-preferring alcohol dehydrogenase
MKAMLLESRADLGSTAAPLRAADVPAPEPGPGEVLVRVSRCGVCRTELDEIEGRAPPPRLPVIPGHQAVGVIAAGPLAGQRVGVAWIASACGTCNHCAAGAENLCAAFCATGRDVNGGYAGYMTVRSDFVHQIPAALTDAEAAPLLCAGAIGWRALRLARLADGEPLGLMGFGGSNHLVLKMARRRLPRSPVFVFTRNPAERAFALRLGATWAGAIGDEAPAPAAAIIDTTPAWTPVTAALRRLAPGGRLVINAIRKEEADKDALLALDYPAQLWLEKEIRSVANVTRADVRECLAFAAAAGIRPEIEEYPLADANSALMDLKRGRIRGAKVLRIAD